MEQHYHSVMQVVSGAPVSELARPWGVLTGGILWLDRCQRDGLQTVPGTPLTWANVRGRRHFGTHLTRPRGTPRIPAPGSIT